MVLVLLALRPVACFLSIGLTIASFHLAQVQMHWLTLIAVLMATATTMLQNDWRDREHDAVRKKKRFALDNEEDFFCVLILIWMCTLALIVVVYLEHPALGALLGFMAFAGAVYSETRRIPMVPITIVAITSASPTLLPVTLGGDLHNVAPLFVATVLGMFANEIVKDLDDEGADRGYKWTIPIALGAPRTKCIAVCTLVAALLVAAQVTPRALLGGLPILDGVRLLLTGASLKKVENRLDLGMALILILLTLHRR